MKKIIIIAVSLLVSGWLSAQNMTKVEYFFDTDPGYGAGTAVTITTPLPDVADFSFNIPVTGLSNGFHHLYVRGMDQNKNWSSSVHRTFFKQDIPVTENPFKLSKIEYFLDSDPGVGSGNPVTYSTAEVWDAKTFTIDLTSVSNGFHKLFIRCMDDSGKWSTTTHRTFYKQDIPVTVNPYTVSKLEYFFDEDLGYGTGTAVAVTASEVITDKSFTIDLTSLSDGFHKLTLRAADNKGSWSVAASKTFFKYTYNPSSDKNITEIEYFFDTDPGYGSGENLNFTQGTNIEIVDEIDVSGISVGFHKLFIRAKDQNGAWSTANTKTFYSDILPDAVVPTLKYGEYFIDTDSGVGNGTEISFSPNSNLSDLQFTVDLSGLSNGFHKLFMRFKDSNNRWSYSLQKNFYMESALQTTIPDIVYGEYYIDTDLGYGNCTPIASFTGGSNLENVALAVDLSSVSTGFHKLYMRGRDSKNRWGHTLVRTFYKDGSTPNLTGQITEIKYYIGQGNDLNLNSGTLISGFTPSEHIEDYVFEVNLTGMNVGEYYIYATAKDIYGKTSHIAIDNFRICDNVARANFSYTVASRTATFTDLSELAATYSWNFGDGNTSTDPSPVHTYTVNGDYNVCLTVSNDCNSFTFCDSVTVVYNASPTGSNFNVNTNEDQRYTFAYSNFNYSDEEGNAMDHILITAISLSTGDSLLLDGVEVAVDTKVLKTDISKLVFVPALDQAGYRGTVSFKLNDGITYSASTYNASISVTGINDPATYTITNDAIIVVQDAGAITMTDWLTGMDDGDPNENQTISASISVLEGSNLFSVSPQLLQSDYSDLTFTTSSSTTGKARLKLTVVDYSQTSLPYSNTQEEEFSIEIKPFSAQLTCSKTVGCVGEELTFTSTSPTQDISFAWNFGEGATPQTFVGSVPGPVVYSTSGTKSVKLTISGFGKTDDETITIEIQDTPEASFLTGSNVYSLYDTVYFYNTSKGGSQFIWDFGDNTPTVTKTTTESVKHKYLGVQDNDTYTAKITAINGICEDVYEQTFTFKNIAPPTITEENFVTTYSSTQSKIVSVKAEDLFNGLKSTAKFYYKGMKGNQWSNRTVNLTNGNTYSATIEETMGDQVGIQYYFDVFNTPGIKSKSSIGYAYLEFANGLVIPNIVSGVAVENYQIISIPLSLESNAVDSIFNELGDYDNTQWRLFHYTPSALLEYPDFETIDKGKGYWFITRKPITLNTGAGATHVGENFQEYTISLRQGWTQIGNPYIFDVSWADILTANSEDVDKIGDLRVFSNGVFENGTILKEFGGGFVFSDQAGVELTIPIQTTTSHKAPSQRQSTFNSNDWRISLQLTSGNLVNRNIAFGMNPEASKSKDRFDQMTTPRFLSYLEVNFNHPEYFYPFFETDIVPANDNNIWDFTVESNLSEKTTTLSWDNQLVRKLSNELNLVDMKSHRLVDMKDVSKYTFQYDGTRNFKIYYGDQQFINNSLVFDHTTLGDCYPNPFSNYTIIPLFIKGNDKGTGYIELSIYSLDGRKVTTITQGEYKQGFYNFEWNVGSEESSIKPGIYLVKLDNLSDGSSLTKRMVLIR